MAHPSTPALDRRRIVLLAAALLAITLLVYRPALDNGFVDFDDNQYITANPMVLAGLTPDTVTWALTAQVASNWHPLTVLSHMADVTLFGLEPRGHHLTSVALHAINVALLFLVLATLTGSTWRSFAVAALFALHPTRVESVAWISERKDVLSGLFWIAAMACYVRYARAPSVRRYVPVAVLMALGLAAKPMVVTLPCALLLLDAWPLKRLPPFPSPGFGARFGRLAAEKIPLFALAAAASFMALATQDAALDQVDARTLGERATNAVHAYGAYLVDTFWPTDLAALYPFDPDLGMGPVAASLLVLVGLTALTFLARDRAPWAAVGWLWFVGILIPVIGLIPVGGQARADRFTYLPSIGLFVLLVWGLAAVVRDRPLARRLTLFGALAIGASLVLATRAQIRTWHDTESLFRHAIAVTRDNHLAHHNLGEYLRLHGRHDEAVAQFEQAIAAQPDWPAPYAGLGSTLAATGRTEAAVRAFEASLARDASEPRVHHALAMALDDLGRADEARSRLEEAVRLAPGFAAAHHGLGTLFERSGAPDRAIEHYRAALRADPDLPLHGRLGMLLGRSGALEEAATWFGEATRRRPQDPGGWFNLGVTLRQLGRLQVAEAALRQALALAPPPARAGIAAPLAEVLDALGRQDEARALRRETGGSE